MEISIQPVTKENRKEVLALAVRHTQESFVETPAQCLEEARTLALWRPVAIYVRDKVVGFAMYGKFEEEGENGRVWLDRLLIGAPYQGKGYGNQAVRALCGRLCLEYGCEEIYLSCYAENKRAVALYQRAGFRLNGEKDSNGEAVMVKNCSR